MYTGEYRSSCRMTQLLRMLVAGPPMSHHNHGSLDDRTQRQKQKLQDKLSKRHKDGGYPHHRVGSPRRAQRKSKPLLNVYLLQQDRRFAEDSLAEN